MAGDWIKMRGELWTNPRFIALSNALIFGGADNRGFLTYACGEDALGIGVMPPSNKNITELALRGVTKRALRDVTMCALLRVWTAVNAHGKVSGNDAICQPMEPNDLDEIAGFDGFGHALALIGWLEYDEDNDALIFKNFLDHNEPACLRKKPLTNAERQAKFRAENGGNKKRVTKSNESNAREEEKREEIKTSAVRGKSAIPDGWKPKPATVDSLAESLKLSNGDVLHYVEPFRDACHAKDYRYKDFDAAFRNCVRQDWPKLRNGHLQTKVAVDA